MKAPALAATLIACAAAGCATAAARQRVPEPTYAEAANSELVASNYRAADALMAQFGGTPAGGPLIVATAVNIDALELSSTLGRMISEQVSARFSQRSWLMVEMKLRGSIYMRRGEGELILTREIGEIARTHQAQAVIGSYALGASTVYVNRKIVRPGSNVVLSAHDYVLPANQEVRTMLGRSISR
ncbi:FlgO family outer membrane protein [Accumulibacter sp.]|uniref:FlgO family outer membrane protein n=1 Tax=Accumulibacter sp. TaxID=2053492 RepID=UPI0025E4D365|nr:FlgO family outer membrane protein [Accumulibacter sp.]MCM8611490.1 FlgO family outer membrane protein [Accumulibacter sp.]MCM8635124.1 FlgO family outer membrane protein [Accumulibacter sp.]MCM8641047.1 FlgO family outer membrane protein [Accumulibacter sp.]